MNKHDRELFVIVMIACIFLATAFAIITTARANVPEPKHVASWQPPDIPQCEKELWIRITEGCEE